MKKICIFILILLSSFVYGVQPIEITSFYYPPYMGKNPVSEDGLLFDVVNAAFQSVQVPTITNLIPVKRGIYQVKINESIAYIGILDTFDKNVIKNLEVYPLVDINFIMFYLKEKFPKGISYNKYSDLKPYTFAVLAGGITEVVAKNNNLKIDSVYNFASIFEKVKTKRVDVGLAVDLSIDLWIKDLYKDSEYMFAKNIKKPFVTKSSVIVFNKTHPDYKIYKEKFEIGLENIVRNGEFLKILETYYGKGKVSKQAITLIQNTIKSFK